MGRGPGGGDRGGGGGGEKCAKVPRGQRDGVNQETQILCLNAALSPPQSFILRDKQCC